MICVNLSNIVSSELLEIKMSDIRENSQLDDWGNEGLHRKNARLKLKALLGDDSIQKLLRRSDLRGAWALFTCWGMIVAAMMCIVWANSQPLVLAIPVIVAAMLIIAGRQLGLSILMHEASHRSLFKNAWLNDTLADWLCGQPIMVPVTKYRKHHMIHHANTGTEQDNDYSLVKGFPTTRMSLLRKFTRDLLGITGLKALFAIQLMNIGVLKFTVSNDVEKLDVKGKPLSYFIKNFFVNAWRMVLIHIVMASICVALGHGELYGIWWLCYLSPYQAFIRIRSLAEHAMTELSPNMLKNTRSTKAGFMARLLVAPYRVNFHIEHHALAAVPHWQLANLHKMLREKGAVPKPPGYLQVLNMVSSKAA